MIIKPKNEKRIINYHIFENNIKVILISDMNIDKSYIVSSVNVGSYQNKDYYDGMAHLLEHMCFIGSKKFPKKNHLINKAQEFGGYTNAFTSLYETVYHVEVLNKHLDEIFDILIDCLINSKLDEEHIYNELQNVDSEHMKNINNDNWKLFNMFHFLGNKKSNYNGFFTGSLKTLDRKDLYKKMLDFYETYYHANNFSFCIASNYNPNDLYKLVKKYIELIPKTSKKNVFKLIKPLYTNKGKAYYIESIDKRNEIIYIFETNYNQFYYYLGNIIRNQNENLLVDKLRNLGYIINLSTEYDYDGVFKIIISLTDLKYIKQVDSYLKSFINCIYQLNLKTIHNYYNEIQKFTFDNQVKINTLDLALGLIENLRLLESLKIPIKKIYPGCPYIYQLEMEEINFNNCIQLVFSNKKIKNDKFSIESNYKTKYKSIKFINEDIHNCKFTFNFKNNYLTNNVSIKKLKETFVNKNKRIWFGQTSKFNENMVILNIIFHNKKLFSTPKNIILTDILMDLLNYQLEKKLSVLFDVGYNVNFIADSINEVCILNFNMFNDDKINNKIIEDVFDIISEDINISDIFIKNIIDNHYKLYSNIKNLNPYDYCEFIFKSKLTHNFSIESYIDEIKKLKQSSNLFKDIKKILFNSSVSLINLGNIEKIIKLPELKNNLNLSLPEEPKIHFKNNIIVKSNQKNNKCIKISYFIGKFDPNIVIHLMIIVQIFETIFFEEMRTKEKLGYLTKMEYSSINGNYYLFQKIQTTIDLEIVLKLINNFNNNLIIKLNYIELDFIKEIIVDILKIKPNNTIELFMKYYYEIYSRQYLFNRNKLLINEIKNVTKESLIQFIQKYIFNNKFINTIKII